MSDSQRREGPATPLRLEVLEDRNAPTRFGSWSFGGWCAYHPPKPAHAHHGACKHTPPAHSHGKHHGHGYGHCGKPHKPPSPPPPVQTGSVSGVVYLDQSFDGVRDAGEPGLDGLVVWADVNGNGVQDQGETTTTAADGSYTLTGLPAGVEVAVTVSTNNGAASTPATVTPVAGQTVTGDIAVRPTAS